MTKYLYACLLLFCLFLISACEKPKTNAVVAKMPVNVTVMTVKPETIPVAYDYVGFARSSHEVEIRARISGYLDVINDTEGMHVEKDALLFKIDPRPFEAALDDAKGDLAKQEAMLWEAERSVARLKPLFEQKAASRRDLDNAIAQKLSSEALVQSSEARVRQAQLDLDYTIVRAPMAGEIGASNYRVGALVIANETLLATLSVVDPIWINFSVPERDMLKARNERKEGLLLFPKDDDFEIEVVLINGVALPKRGRVNFFSPTYDVKTGTMMVRAQLPNPKGWLSPGQFVRVRVLGATRPNAIAIPQRAVIQSKNGMIVYVVGANSTAEQRSVQVGSWNGDKWIILSGLKSGDDVVVDGINKIGPGSPLNVVLPSTGSAFQ